MHISFDLYPNYLRDFSKRSRPSAPYQLTYAIHAMRNYEYRNEGGKRTGPYPQVRPEGSLTLNCLQSDANADHHSMEVTHIRSWSTWTGQEHASKQTISAQIDYTANTVGSPENWNLSYQSAPIPPVKSYRYDPLGPLKLSGQRRGNRLSIQSSTSLRTRHYDATSDSTCLYTLIARLQAGATQAGKVDFLDDLSMFRPGLEITPLPEQTIEIEGQTQPLHGFALVGPATLPLYFWQDANDHVLAVIGRNVAYTLAEVTS